MFSVEKAICPSVSSPRLEPTGRKAGGYLKVGRMDNEEEEGMTKGRRVAQRKDREEQRKIESKGEKNLIPGEVIRDAKAPSCSQKQTEDWFLKAQLNMMKQTLGLPSAARLLD